MQIGELFVRFGAGRGIDRLFARLFAEYVDDFVLEDAGEPGPQRGAAGEAVGTLHRGQQSFLYDIVGAAGVAQMKQGVTIEVVAMLGDVGWGIAGGIHARQSKRFAFAKQAFVGARSAERRALEIVSGAPILCPVGSRPPHY